MGQVTGAPERSDRWPVYFAIAALTVAAAVFIILVVVPDLSSHP